MMILGFEVINTLFIELFFHFEPDVFDFQFQLSMSSHKKDSCAYAALIFFFFIKMYSESDNLTFQ